MPEERRVVTVLFADVTGSTELAEAVDPEEVRALLGRYYGLAKEVVGSHGGTVEKFIGDAVMAVFGLPMAHGDDAERALSAALELRDRVRSDPKLGERIPVRIGVNTGEVVAAREAIDDFLVTGDAVNMAARLQQAAEPWQILCGERTVRAARNGFLFGPLATIVAKGKRAGIVAAPVTGRAAKRRTRLPLIGRDADLAQLELVARRVVTEGRPSLVSIIAPAGTGKTRLLEELIDRLPELAPDAFMAIAQCLPYGQRLTYWPLRAMLFRLVGLGDDASSADARATIRSWLGSRQVGDPDRVTELLAATVGVGEQEVTDKAALFGAWRTVIEVASRDRPLVLVFEDLHWSSDSLLDLVEFVMQPRTELRALTIALARPELLDRRPTWGGGRRSYVALPLEPLSDDAIASIVRHLLEASSPAVVERVVARAEGNPFFATELVRALIDRLGALGDAAAVDVALRTLPDTVQGTVLARMDLLGPTERRVLQLGAVLGRSFRAQGVETLATADIAHGVVTGIEGLVERDLVRPTGVDAYTFRHILIREVAYQTLPRTERASLHAAAARWLEATAAGREDGLAELIAYHYREAASLASTVEAADAAEIAAKATTWLMRAGEVALAAVALVEAKRHFAAALELADPALHPVIHERLGDVSLSGSEAVASYRLARDLVRARGSDPDRGLRLIAAELGVLMRSQGSVAKRPSEGYVHELIADGARLLERAADDRAVARFHIARAFLPFWHQVEREPRPDELEAAEASARRGLEIAERLGDRRMQSAALDALGSVAELSGDAAASREMALRRIAMGDRLDLVERLDAAAMATWMSIDLGLVAEAVRVSGSMLPQVLPGQAVSWTLHLCAWRALSLLLGGMLAETIAMGERMRELWAEADRPTAGYAQRGFEAAHAAAIARKDSPAAERMREVARALERGYEQARPAIRGRIALLDPRPAPEVLDAAIADVPRPGRELIVRILTVAADQRLDLATVSAGDPGLLERLAAVGYDRYPLVLGAAQRAIGVARDDRTLLASAQALFERCGAVLCAARARVEAGLVRGDRDAVAAGMAELERLGDLAQLERYERHA